MRRRQNVGITRPYQVCLSQKSLKLGLCLAAVGWSVGCAEPSTAPRITLDQIQQQVAARNKFAWVGEAHNKALDFIHADMKKGGKYHSPGAYCGALKKAVKKYYAIYHPVQTEAAIAQEDKLLNACGSPTVATSSAAIALAPSRTIVGQPGVAFNLVDTIPNFNALSANARKYLSMIDYYVSLYGTTADLSNALARVDASANSNLSGGEQEVVLSTSAGTVSSSAYWEENMYSWAAVYEDTASTPPPQYSITLGSVGRTYQPGLDIKTAPTGAAFGWGDCWGYVIQSACNAAKMIVGADVSGIAAGAIRAWYSGAFWGGPTGAGVIAGAGLATGAGTSAAAGGWAVIGRYLQ